MGKKNELIYDTLDDLFKAKTWLDTDSGCWIWYNAKIYGSVNWGLKNWQTHVLSYTHSRGPVPKGLFVCHHCDVKSCCNPNHLFLGTAFDNMQDCSKKGRIDKVKKLRGPKHGNAIFTAKQVRVIRADKRYGTVIAREYGCNNSSIYDIKKRHTYKDVK